MTVIVFASDLTHDYKIWMTCYWEMGWTEIEVKVGICVLVIYRSGYAISSRLLADIPERMFVLKTDNVYLRLGWNEEANSRNWRRSSSLHEAHHPCTARITLALYRYNSIACVLQRRLQKEMHNLALDDYPWPPHLFACKTHHSIQRCWVSVLVLPVVGECL